MTMEIPTPMRPSSLVPSLLVLASTLAAGETLPQRVPLVLTDAGDAARFGNLGHAFLQPEGIGPASIPFATADGKLRVLKKEGGWLVDRNGDGKLDDTDLPLIAGAGDTCTVPLRLAGTVTPCTLRVMHAQENWLYLTGSSTLDATVGGQRLRLVDRNLDGRFDEAGVDGVMQETPADQGPAQVVPLTRIVRLGDRLMHIAVVEDGAALTCTPYDGPVAQVTAELVQAAKDTAFKASGMSLVLVAADHQAALCIAGTGRQIAVPGTYRIEQDHLTLTMPPAKGGLGTAIIGALIGQRAAGGERQAMLFSGQQGSVTLTAGDNTLKRGVPDRLSFTATTDGEGGVTIADAMLEDGHGGAWRASLNGSDGTLACLAKKGAVTRQLTTMEYG